MVRLRPGLLVIPAVSAAFTGSTAAVLLLGPWSLDVIRSPLARAASSSIAASCAYPFTFITAYFNVAFYVLAAATFDGRPMTTS